MFRRTRRKVQRALGRAYRQTVVRHVPVVAITGSCGKTTTAFLTTAILQRHGRVLQTTDGNAPRAMWNAVFSLRPWHAYGVQEVSGAHPRDIRRSMPAVRPTIGVVTTIGYDHYSTLRGPDGAAKAKGWLVRCLPKSGHALLNADDERVLAMSTESRAPVTTFGLSEHADLRASNVLATWPERLRFDATWRGETLPVTTKLLPNYDAHSVLGAIATGLVTGVPFADCIARVANVNPIPGRMQPIETPRGVTFINDTWKAPLWTLPAALDYMHTANAPRKAAVIGTISDYPGSMSPKYRNIARLALESMDRVLFVGPNASSVRRTAATSNGRLAHVETITEARRWLDRTARSGDLVLLEGSAAADHLERLYLDHLEQVDCWTDACCLVRRCSTCRRRQTPYSPTR